MFRMRVPNSVLRNQPTEYTYIHAHILSHPHPLGMEWRIQHRSRTAQHDGVRLAHANMSCAQTNTTAHGTDTTHHPLTLPWDQLGHSFHLLHPNNTTLTPFSPNNALGTIFSIFNCISFFFIKFYHRFYLPLHSPALFIHIHFEELIYKCKRRTTLMQTIKKVLLIIANVVGIS